jgi:predicted nucleic acid-binding protein
MRVSDAFDGITKVFLDTAPVVYYVEAHPTFGTVARAAFTLISDGKIQAIASPVTLAECVTLPIKLDRLDIRQVYRNLLTSTDGILLVGIDAAIGELAAELRIRYGLKLPDALQVATAISSGCDAFLTNDAALKKVKELRVLVLLDLEN